MGLLLVSRQEQKVRLQTLGNLTTKQRFGKYQKEALIKASFWISLCRSISRILSSVVIYLGPASPPVSSGLPGSYPSVGEEAGHSPALRPSFLLGLAPNGGCLAAPVARRAGGLLHHLFTLTWSHNLRRSVSVALSAGCPARVLPGAVPCGVRTFLVLAYTVRRARLPDQRKLLFQGYYILVSRQCPVDDLRRREEARARCAQPLHAQPPADVERGIPLAI